MHAHKSYPLEMIKFNENVARSIDEAINYANNEFSFAHHLDSSQFIHHQPLKNQKHW